ncbi:DUF4129 domain-containing protein [Nocardia goodfellowii]|uniref:Protein-glutamine gamma-glutamyltransferase-like C-terminal domain-containing protein n=1 Tax=Nocardia goodfellowii TaxID=882446 RepID=A0ABS4QJR3_9NOCA|nr:DUF4129 domain-containing protein [Nocardia goodfellowii]MBP2191818.1 hypothetical protein [Nocardia goodfellowii]
MTLRVLVMLGLLGVTVVAVGGYLPAAEPPSPHQDSPAERSVVPLAAVSVIALFLIGLTVLAYLRRPPVPVLAGNADQSAGGRGPIRFSGRDLFVAAVVCLALALPLGVAMVLTPRGPLAAETRPPERTQPPESVRGEPVSAAPTQRDRRSEESPLAGVGVVAGSVLLVSLGALVVVAVRSARRAPVTAVADEPVALREVVARATTCALTEMSEPHHDPRGAVLACYYAMEREFAGLPAVAPVASDTPSEVLGRAVRGGVVSRTVATRLVTLFAVARFSGHVMGERDRIEAAAILRAVLEELDRGRR